MFNKKIIIISSALFLILIIIIIVIHFFSQPKTIKIKLPVKVKVATSFYPLYFMAKEIGGQHARVINITPAGAEPHDYEPTPINMMEIINSQLLILNGGNLAAWGSNIKQIINPERTVLIFAAAGLNNRRISENGRSIIDPHVWLSPVLAQQMVNKITLGFIAVDPNNKNYYQIRAAKFKFKLKLLNQEYIQGLKHCVKKDIVTTHAAFGYLAAQYKLKQLALTGLSPNSEPSPRQLVNLIKLIKKQHLKYIFFESLASPKLAETIAQELGAKTLELNPIEGLTSREIRQGKNYFTEMRANLINLKIALECQS